MNRARIGRLLKGSIRIRRNRRLEALALRNGPVGRPRLGSVALADPQRNMEHRRASAIGFMNIQNAVADNHSADVEPNVDAPNVSMNTLKYVQIRLNMIHLRILQMLIDANKLITHFFVSFRFI